MEKVLYLFCALMFITSCSNDSESLNIQGEENLNLESELISELADDKVYTWDEYVEYVKAITGIAEPVDVPEQRVTTRAGFVTKKFYGYDTAGSLNGKAIKVAFNTAQLKLLNSLGVSYSGSIMICEVFLTQKRMLTPTGYSRPTAVSSPKCGSLTPWGWDTRGYAGVADGNYYVGNTYTTKVISDMSGRSINRYLPILGTDSRSLNDLEWVVEYYVP